MKERKKKERTGWEICCPLVELIESDMQKFMHFLQRKN